jgi:hypothetical protein
MDMLDAERPLFEHVERESSRNAKAYQVDGACRCYPHEGAPVKVVGEGRREGCSIGSERKADVRGFKKAYDRKLSVHNRGDSIAAYWGACMRPY